MYDMRKSPSMRNGLIDLINFIPLDSFNMVEIGSYAGESADLFASSPKTRTIWCIDPWLSGYDNNDPASSTDFVEVESTFDTVMEKHNGKINKFKGVAKEFIEQHPEFVPDFAYIDANHTYEGCKDDISTALKWKGRGLKFLGGHDYASWCPGVIQAVNEAFGKPDWTFSDSSWLVKIS